MTPRNTHRYVLPLGLAALAFPAVMGSGCGVLDAACDDTIGARMQAFANAVDALVSTSAALKSSVGQSCAAIATDLGQTGVPDVSDTSASDFDDRVTQACQLANAALDAEFQAGATLAIEVIGGQCTVDANAQFSCEAQCTVSGSCDPGSIELRCEPGQLSGQCSAECSGECTVTSGSVACEGSCSGTCNGDCQGECAVKGGNGKCAGKCSGTCNGGCTGTCKVVAPMATCSGSCKGGCSVDFQAPKCEGTIEPPSCDIDADCQAGCSAEAQLSAECTPPEIKVTVSGGVSGNLGKTLEENLPALYTAAIEQGPKVVEAAATVAEKGVAAADAALDSVACVAEYGADIASKFEASVSASVSVSVSIQASASVTAKTGAGG